jgi:hypothetical protein
MTRWFVDREHSGHCTFTVAIVSGLLRLGVPMKLTMSGKFDIHNVAQSCLARGRPNLRGLTVVS